MSRFNAPGFVTSLKDARYWSLDWIAENGIEGPFAYVILLKDGTGYKIFGQYATATEAFEDRRLLCEEHGTRSFFLRAVRLRPVVIVGPDDSDSCEDLDRWRDALATCDETLIADSERPAYRQWAAKEIGSRSLYRPTSRVPF